MCHVTFRTLNELYRYLKDTVHEALFVSFVNCKVQLFKDTWWHSRGCRLSMTFCVERHAAAEFVVLRFVFMAEAGFMWSGERCDNTDACLM